MVTISDGDTAEVDENGNPYDDDISTRILPLCSVCNKQSVFCTVTGGKHPLTREEIERGLKFNTEYCALTGHLHSEPKILFPANIPPPPPPSLVIKDAHPSARKMVEGEKSVVLKQMKKVGVSIKKDEKLKRGKKRSK